MAQAERDKEMINDDEERRRLAEVEAGIPFEPAPQCPECGKTTTKEELAMFNGFCEDCKEEAPGDYD